MLRTLARLGPQRLALGLWRRVLKARAQRLPFDFVARRKIVVVAVTLNRGGWRLENFLRTLRHQTLPSKTIHIAVVDFGSERSLLEHNMRLCNLYSAQLICMNQPRDIFCKSWALNVGIRQSPEDAEIVLATDIDMMFRPNFVEQIVGVHRVFNPELVLCAGVGLPRGVLDKGADVVQSWNQFL